MVSRMGHDVEMQSISDNQTRLADVIATESWLKVGGAEVLQLANEEAVYPQKFLFLFSGGETPFSPLSAKAKS